MSESSRVARLLAGERAVIAPRARPGDLGAVAAAGGLVVDTRPAEQRSAHGELPGALVVDRNLLEWRLDPTSPHRLPEVVPGQRVVIVCNEGYSSTLAAATLQRLGVDATDLEGGFQAWLRWRSDGAG